LSVQCCGECGSKMVPAARFCADCGAHLGGSASYAASGEVVKWLKETAPAPVRLRRPSHAGVLMGIFACLFGILGIVTFFHLALVFVFLAALFSVIGMLRGLVGRSGLGFSVSSVGAFLTVAAFIVSPSVWIAAAGLFAASQAPHSTKAIKSENAEQAVTAKPDLALASPRGATAAAGDIGVKQVPLTPSRFFEGTWAKTAAECEDEDGPSSQTIIDLDNTIDGKKAPLFEQYENHCLIDRTSISGNAVTFNATCYEFWEYFKKKKNGQKAMIKVLSLPNGGLNIEGKNFTKCKPR
jgi:hypothetical protein